MPKITFMGAGSTVFAKNVLGDSMLTPALENSVIALYDIDEKRLEESYLMLTAISNNLGNKARIEKYCGVENRKDALRGAKYVINAIQVGGYEPCTVTDFEIPKKYGLRQTIADTLGIGGIFRALRTIPVMIDFAHDMEEVCPDAWFLNYTNPMAMLTGAMLRYTGIKTVGLCHSVQGCPGAGKTMIARRIPGILPPLSMEESMEISSVYSVAGKLDGTCSFVTKRPFLYPHHTVSQQAMAGGGKVPRPGMISLAHRAVLFLDEFPEFSRNVIEVLRQPMEDKMVQIARSQAVYTYPANFMLVAAANPCPCGYFPDRNRCRCTEQEIQKYLNKISGPILDRIDLSCEMSSVHIEELCTKEKAEDSNTIRMRVLGAWQMQQKRFEGTKYHFNADIGSQDVAKYCTMEEKAEQTLRKLFVKLQLSARAYYRILKVSRTIADLEQEEKILERHIKEAACYRINLSDGLER